ncbi:MAG: hypothetical protein SNH27_10425 [Rikenellaceae bacterium]
MATTEINITVRLHIHNDKVDSISEEDIQNIVSEMDYTFTNDGDFEIVETEICGINE